MRKTMHFLTLSLAIALMAVASPGLAMGAGSTTDVPAAKAADPNYAAGKQAVDAKNWPLAIQHLTMAASSDPKNADVHNYLGYAYRNSGNLDQAFASYAKALELDPKHKGAHEYLGEAYLMKGDVAKAEEMLGKLDKLCFFTCAEYTELKTRIAEHKAKKSS